MDKMTPILDKLIKRTQEGKLQWSATVDPNGFMTHVEEIGVIVRSLGKQSLAGEDRYKVEVLNRDGRISDEFETADEYGLIPDHMIASAGQSQAMGSLYSLARRSALDSEATLDDLVQQLDAIA